MSGELVSTVIVVLFLIHPTVVKVMLSVFSCTRIEEDWWLTDELNIRCWDDEHVSYGLRVALPALLGWGIGMPVVCLVLLFKHKKRLGEQEIKLKYGFLYLGYNS